MEKRGSQTRETLEEAKLTFLRYIGSTKPGNRGVILINEDGKQELWGECDDFAGYVVVVDGVGYEFMSSAMGDWIKP